MQASWPTITDWDDAYNNAGSVPDADIYLDRWEAAAPAFRGSARGELDIAYGDDERQQLDLFLPVGAAKGLAVVIHGGYWLRFDRFSFSHLAAGAVARGWAVAMPSYRLAPDARITDITQDAAAAIETAARRIDGPICVTGHSAGGHLASRMVCTTSPLTEATRRRITRCVSISGVHDLRPLMVTEMNETLKLDEAEAAAESPALLRPATDTAVEMAAWVGGAELPEFVRQAILLANVWTGLGSGITCEVVPALNHFDIIEGLEDADSPLMAAFVGS